MTEPRSMKPGRIDLRALDDSWRKPDFDRIVARALEAHAVSRTDPGTDDAFGVSYRVTWIIAAASMVVTVGIGTLLAGSNNMRESELPPTVADWARAGYVPTNGELLVTFQRYGP